MQSSNVTMHTRTHVFTNIDLVRCTCDWLGMNDQCAIASTCSSIHAAISPNLHYCICSSCFAEVTYLFATTFQNTSHSQLSIQLNGCERDVDCHMPTLDLSVMSDVYSLEMSSFNIQNISALGSLHTLRLTKCECVSVTDVSALGGVHTLTLSKLPITKDVSALGTVHTLQLPNYVGITDVSALGTVKSTTVRNLVKWSKPGEIMLS
jgi:hypothetical protein